MHCRRVSLKHCCTTVRVGMAELAFDATHSPSRPYIISRDKNQDQCTNGKDKKKAHPTAFVAARKAFQPTPIATCDLLLSMATRVEVLQRGRVPSVANLE